MADYYGASNGGSLWPDVQGETMMPTGSPEDRAGDMSQGYMPSMPMVQPLIVVPYSGQMQPLSQYSPDGANLYPTEDVFYDENYNDAPVRARGANISAIFGLLLGLVAIALLVLGYLVKDLSFLNVIKGENGSAVGVIMGLFEKTEEKPDILDLMAPIGLAVFAVFTVIGFLTNLFSIKAQRYPIFGKIVGLLGFVGMVLCLAMLFVGKKEIEIGAYILTGLAVVSAIVALTGRRKA